MRNRILVLTAVVLALTSCNGEKRRLTQRLPLLEQEYREASRRLTAHRSAMTAAEERLRGLKGDLALHETERDRYLRQHEIAAACIRVARLSWGGEGERSGEVPKGAKVGGALCTVALLNALFAQEVANVTQHLAQLDLRARELREQIAAEQKGIEERRAEMDAAAQAVDRASADLASLEQQLSQR